MCVVLNAHPVRSESHIQRNVNREVPTTIPPFYNEPQRSHVVFVWSLHLAWPSHPGHSTILFDQKARVACAQSFTLWQPETIEIIQWNQSLIAYSRHVYTGVGLHTYPVRGESHIQCNANWEVAIVLGPTERLQ